jgi:alcohol dehydrogenase class IV
VLSERERSFTWRDGERVVRFGADALDEAASLLADHGFEGYALLTTPRAGEFAPSLAGMADRVLAVPPGPVPNAAAAVRGKVGQRPLVALGGGRVIDSAKAIGAADGLAVAAVPTTLSGAELTGFHRLPAGVERVKLVRPSLVVAVPELMASQPMPALAASAMNALAHAAESLYSTGANPVAELVALRAAALIRGGLTSSGEGPMPEALALGSLLAAYALDSAGYAVHHVVCQTLVRATGTPHAETNAVMLPNTLCLVARRGPAVLGRLAAALGAPREEARAAPEAVVGLVELAGPTRLEALGVRRESLAEVADAAARRAELGNTPQPPGRDELLAMLEAAF